MAEYFAGGHLRFLDGEWRDDNGNVVEIKEVKYGHWTHKLDCNGYTCYECSECKTLHEYSTDYCPNCGANM